MPHDIQCRVYYEDTDAGGVMYHANHIKFCERGRSEFLHAVGLKSSELHAQTGVLFVVRHIEADYFRPARLDDLLTVRTSLVSMKNTSFSMRQDILKNGETLFTMKVLLVTVGTDGRPTALPDFIKTLFNASLEHSV